MNKNPIFMPHSFCAAHFLSFSVAPWKWWRFFFFKLKFIFFFSWNHRNCSHCDCFLWLLWCSNKRVNCNYMFYPFKSKSIGTDASLLLRLCSTKRVIFSFVHIIFSIVDIFFFYYCSFSLGATFCFVLLLFLSTFMYINKTDFVLYVFKGWN